MPRLHLRQVKVPEAAVVEPQHELELVGPHEDLGVVAAERLDHFAAHQHRASPEGEEAGPVGLGEDERRILRAHDLERHEVCVPFLGRSHGATQPVGWQVAVVVEREHPVAAGGCKAVVEPADANVPVANDQPDLGKLIADHLG